MRLATASELEQSTTLLESAFLQHLGYAWVRSALFTVDSSFVRRAERRRWQRPPDPAQILRSRRNRRPPDFNFKGGACSRSLHELREDAGVRCAPQIGPVTANFGNFRAQSVRRLTSREVGRRAGWPRPAPSPTPPNESSPAFQPLGRARPLQWPAAAPPHAYYQSVSTVVGAEAPVPICSAS